MPPPLNARTQSLSLEIPSLHPHKLTHAQRSLCEKNPTYVSNLLGLISLREEMEKIRCMLVAEAAGKIPGTGRKSTDKRTSGESEVRRRCEREYTVLERKLREWDEELALLAEGLVARPRFRNDQEVRFADGKWWWALPSGSVVVLTFIPDLADLLDRAATLSRQSTSDSDNSAVKGREEPRSKTKKMARRVSRFWRAGAPENKITRRTSLIDYIF